MTPSSPTILIVEDEAKMRRLLELNLADDGFQTLSAGDAESGLKLLQNGPVDLVLTDLNLPGMNGLDFLAAVKRFHASLPVVVITAFGTVETAVEAMKAGASDYVLKPFSLTKCAWWFTRNWMYTACVWKTERCAMRCSGAISIPT